MNPISESQHTHHIWSSRADEGVSIVRMLEKIGPVMTAPHCICFYFMSLRWHCVIWILVNWECNQTIRCILYGINSTIWILSCDQCITTMWHICYTIDALISDSGNWDCMEMPRYMLGLKHKRAFFCCIEHTQTDYHDYTHTNILPSNENIYLIQFIKIIQSCNIDHLNRVCYLEV